MAEKVYNCPYCKEEIDPSKVAVGLDDKAYYACPKCKAFIEESQVIKKGENK